MPWDARPVADSCQLASRVQSAVRFQVASSLQPLLDAALPGLQVPTALLSCIGLHSAVRAGASAFVLLRDIAFIQLGQCIMAAADDVEHASPPDASIFLLRTLLLCLPPLALGIGAGLGMRSTVTDYVQGAVTAYQYRYAADAGAFLQSLEVGATPVLLGIAALRVSSGMQQRGPPGLLSPVYLCMHLILVDLILYDLKHIDASPHVRLALSVLALVALDAVIAVLDHEPDCVHTTLQQIRGFALWRVAQQLVQGELKDLDVALASCLATLLLVFRTALALVRPPAVDKAPSLVSTLAEVGLLSGVQMLLAPSTANAGQNLSQHLLRIMYVATAAAWVEKALSGK
jgi:hypothetical protein